jgi:hypothetical protein
MKKIAGLGFLGVVGLVLLFLLVYSPLVFGLGYLSGWLAKVTIGGPLIHGINAIFGTAFTKDILPIMGGALAWIGSFFKSSSVKASDYKWD